MEKSVRLYERRYKFRYIIEKGVQGKNNKIRNLSSCEIQRFNCHNILKPEIKRDEKQFHEPVDVIYEPVVDSKPRNCFFYRQFARCT